MIPDRLLDQPTTSVIVPPVPVPAVSVPPKTTAEQDLRTAGQRRINLIWEYTQAGVALSVVFANLAFAFALLWVSDFSTHAAAGQSLLANAFFLVIGFYFGRTNHARIGDDNRNTGSLDDR